MIFREVFDGGRYKLRSTVSAWNVIVKWLEEKCIFPCVKPRLHKKQRSCRDLYGPYTESNKIQRKALTSMRNLRVTVSGKKSTNGRVNFSSNKSPQKATWAGEEKRIIIKWLCQIRYSQIKSSFIYTKYINCEWTHLTYHLPGAERSSQPSYNHLLRLSTQTDEALGRSSMYMAQNEEGQVELGRTNLQSNL